MWAIRSNPSSRMGSVLIASGSRASRLQSSYGRVGDQPETQSGVTAGFMDAGPLARIYLPIAATSRQQSLGAVFARKQENVCTLWCCRCVLKRAGRAQHLESNAWQVARESMCGGQSRRPPTRVSEHRLSTISDAIFSRTHALPREHRQFPTAIIPPAQKRRPGMPAASS